MTLSLLTGGGEEGWGGGDTNYGKWITSLGFFQQPFLRHGAIPVFVNSASPKLFEYYCIIIIDTVFLYVQYSIILTSTVVTSMTTRVWQPDLRPAE